MKLTVSVTVETPQGDKMVPHTIDLGPCTNNRLRMTASGALEAILTKATSFGEHKMRAASIVVHD